jgi:peptidyl-prolyl cis-trans isomerase C
MFRRIALLGLVAASLAACSSGPNKSGPAVAKGNGITITADEFKARLDEQSPFIRARYSTLERKKEFLDNLIRFEVLAKEAERQGLDKDPEVVSTLRKIMVQKFVQRSFQADATGKDVPDAEVQKYYDEHKDEFFRPRKVRSSAIVFNAAAGAPDRAKKVAAAAKALAKVKADEKKNPLAFQQAVAEFTEDAATKAVSGDLGFKSTEELEKAYGKELATAAFALKAGETSSVIQGAQGVYVIRVTGVQEEMSRTFDQVKPQIAQKISREKKTKDFDEMVKKLRDAANVTVDDKVLDSIAVAAAPAAGAPGMPVMPGMPGTPLGPHGATQKAAPVPAAPMPPPAPAPAPAAAPAKK